MERARADRARQKAQYGLDWMVSRVTYIGGSRIIARGGKRFIDARTETIETVRALRAARRSEGVLLSRLGIK